MHSTYKQGAVLSVGAAVAGKVFSLANSLLIAFYFGASAGTDIYFYILLIAAVLNGWLQGINAAAVVPEFMHLRRGDGRGAMGFANFFLYLYAGAAVLFIILCFAFPRVALSLGSGFEAYYIDKYLNFAGIGALYFTALFMAGFLISLAECHKLFKIYFLLPLNTLFALLLLLLTRSIEASLLGYTMGYWLISAAALYALKKYAAWDFGARRQNFDKKFLHNFAAWQPGAAAWAALAYAPLFLISAWPTAVSAVSYARMLYESLIDIFTSKLNNVAKVKITAAAAAQQFGEAAAALKRTDIILMFILVPVCLFTAFHAFDIVKLFFMRGSFGAGAARGTAYFLAIFILAVPFVSLHNNFINMLAARRLIKETTPLYLIFAVVFIAVFAFAINKWGPLAYPCVFLLFNAALMLANIYAAARFMPGMGYGRHLLYMLKLLGVSAVCAFAVSLFYFGHFFINGFIFVLLNALAFWVLGDIKKFKEAVNIKWKLPS